MFRVKADYFFQILYFKITILKPLEEQFMLKTFIHSILQTIAHSSIIMLYKKGMIYI